MRRSPSSRMDRSKSLKLPRTAAGLAVAATLSLLAWSGIAAAQNKTQNERIDAVFSTVTKSNEPGLAVLVRKDGQTIFEKGYGVRELRTRTRIDAKTNFRLASVTKQFTATCVMMLVRDGKLRYDDHLTDVFPDFPAYGKAITIRNLLNHTSRLLDYEDLLEKQYPNTAPENIPQIKDAEILALMKQQTTTKFPPGTKWEYSNTGFALLAMVVEKKCGKPFGEFLHEHIFAPLKMDNTIAFEKGKNEVRNRAFGHTKVESKWQEKDQSPTSAVLGDGGIYTSLNDMAKWDDALEHHTLLSEQEMQPSISPAMVRTGTTDELIKDGDGNSMQYGFGWFLDPYKGHTRMYHDGDTVSFRTTIQRFTKDHLTVIVFSNRDDLNPQALAEKVADIVLPTQN
jgi:CubicO group peptidase (beta-lactamase class C family)